MTSAVIINGVMYFIGPGTNFVGSAAPLPPYDSTITVDLSSSVGTLQTALGAGHIQHSLEYSSADPTGVGKAQQLERDLAVDWNFTHMTGSTFALRNLSPSLGAAGSSYNWTTSGSTRGLDTSAGAVFPMFKTMNAGKSMLICYSAETFQNGGVANDPPTSGFYSDYANEVVNTIIRSETVGGAAAIRAIGVWNEMKGSYTSGGRTQAKMEAHADLTKAVANAVRAHDPTILITAPHMNLGGYTDSGRADPLNPSSFSGYDFNNLNFWLNRCQVNGVLPDVLTLDYSIVDFAGTAVGIGDLPYIIAGVPRFATIKADADSMMQTAWGLKKPVWWIEQYFDVNLARTQWQGANPVYSQAFQGMITGARYLTNVNAGIGAQFTWQPDSRDGYDADGWWHMTGTSTDTSSGSPYSNYTALKTIRDALPMGTGLFASSADQTYLLSSASATQIAIVNTDTSAHSVRIVVNPLGNQSVITVPAYGVVTQALT